MTRYALYLRVSTEAQAERYSLAAQREKLVAFVESQGGSYEIYEDAGISGETLDARPEMLRLLQDARARRFDVALAVEMTRFSRSRDGFDMAVIKRVFREAGIRYGTPEQVFSPDSAQHNLTSGLFGLLSSFEKEELLRRTMDGRRKAAAAGKYVTSRVLYGFRRVGVGKIEPDPQTAPNVVTMFSMARDSATIREIGRRFGMPPSTVASILSNPAYTGDWVFGSRKWSSRVGGTKKKTFVLRPECEWIHIRIPALVDPVLFAAVRAKLKQNKLMAKRNAKRTYLLRGLVVCGSCGWRMAGRTVNGTNRAYYMCGNQKHTERTCKARLVPMRALDAFVKDHVRRLVVEPQVVLDETKRQRESTVSRRDEGEMRLAYVRKTLAGIAGRRERAQSMFVAGHATADELAREIAKVERERQALDEERTVLEARLAGRLADEAKTAEIKTVMARLRDRIDTLSQEEWGVLMGAFIDKVIVAPDGRGVEIVHYIPVINGGSVQALNSAPS